MSQAGNGRLSLNPRSMLTRISNKMRVGKSRLSGWKPCGSELGRSRLSGIWLLACCVAVLVSCHKGGGTPKRGGGPDTTVTPPPPPPVPFDINSITDTYPNVVPLADYKSWGPYNVHDPSIKNIGNTYYFYSTDVGYG